MSSGFDSFNNQQDENLHHFQSYTTTTILPAADTMYQPEPSSLPSPYFITSTRASTTTHDMMISSSSSSPILPWSIPQTDHHQIHNTIIDPSSFLFSPHPSSYPTTTHLHNTTNLFSIPSHNNPSSSSTSHAAAFHHFGSGDDAAAAAAYHHGPSSSDAAGQLHHQMIHCGPMTTTPFGLQVQAELNKLTAQEMMDAKALAASRSHSEAERRRRERINNHLAKLRSLLPNTTKTDKASLLAEVIQHVKELKRQTSQISETTTIPTESDQLTVDTELISTNLQHGGGMVIKASLCCDDRSDLLPDIIKALKSLRLKTLKAEITTLGGRVKNVLFVTAENDENDPDSNSNMMMISSSSSSNGNCDDELIQQQQQQCTLNSIQLALKSVLEKSCGGGVDESVSGNAKRQRTNTTTPNTST